MAVIDTTLQDRTALAIGLLAFVLGVLPTCTFAQGIAFKGASLTHKEMRSLMP
jgi:hypothetical protein